MITKQQLSDQIAQELTIGNHQVAAVLDLFDENATVPFIARYRKERTGGLDEVQIRAIEERRDYLNELSQRRDTILAAIEEQGKLTPELRRQIESAATKSTLEDLYLPYKPKRRTRAMIAREKGLAPLAERILAQPATGNPQDEAQSFINAEVGIESAQDALDGASDIIAEIVSETAEVRDYLRQFMTDDGEMTAQKTEKADEERSKFEQYYEYKAPLRECKGHRFLAIRRGEREGFLRAQIEIDEERAVAEISRRMHIDE